MSLLPSKNNVTINIDPNMVSKLVTLLQSNGCNSNSSIFGDGISSMLNSIRQLQDTMHAFNYISKVSDAIHDIQVKNLRSNVTDLVSIIAPILSNLALNKALPQPSQPVVVQPAQPVQPTPNEIAQLNNAINDIRTILEKIVQKIGPV